MSQFYPPLPKNRRLLRRENIVEIMEERSLTNREMAEALGIRRSTWYAMLLRQVGFSRRMTERLLDCPSFVGIPEHLLWEEVEVPVRFVCEYWPPRPLWGRAA